MRIIAGKYRHLRFEVPHSFKARPTTDFAKEGLFNILQNRYVDFEKGPVALDLFCGTGSISLELLSRGCSRVVSIEKDFDHYRFINSVLHKLGDRNWKLLCRDVEKFLNVQGVQGVQEVQEVQEVQVVQGVQGVQEVQEPTAKYDLIFADPPYTLPWLGEIPQKVFRSGLLKEGGIFVLEHGKKNDFSDDPHFVDHRCYGSVNFSFFTI